MKYNFTSLIVMLSIFSCSKERELSQEFEDAVQEYQAKNPIPQSKDLKNYIFIYEADFALEGKDTLLRITRRPSGIPKNSDCFGVYIVNNQPLVIYDDENLSSQLIEKKVKNNKLDEYFLSERKKHYVDYPPVYSFKVNESKLQLLKIDTISDNWKK
jgi:hypothetical protein